MAFEPFFSYIFIQFPLNAPGRQKPGAIFLYTYICLLTAEIIEIIEQFSKERVNAVVKNPLKDGAFY